MAPVVGFGWVMKTAALALWVSTSVEGVLRLRHMDSVYFQKSYTPDVYEYGADIVIGTAVSYGQFTAYVVGNQVMHVVDIMQPGQLKIIGHEKFAEPGTFTNAAMCNDKWLALSFDSEAAGQGKVLIYKINARGSNPLYELLHTINPGLYLPEMVLWTQDCKKLVVAVEGEVKWGPTPIDPEGELMIISFPGTPDQSYSTSKIDFKEFNAREEEYISKGVRRVYRGEGMSPNTFSQDLEPEYLAFNDDESILYVTLQEANAIATVDMSTSKVLEIHPLGLVDRSKVKFDPSDKDKKADINSWPVFAARQPDNILYVTLEGDSDSYLVTANEGDDKEYWYNGNQQWAEAQRGKQFVENGQIGSNVDDMLREALAEDTKLGRLKFSTVDDTTFNRFVTYGGRSFSVFRASDMQLVWDSGSQLEEAIRKYIPHVFNANADRDKKPSETNDTRSDDKGMEPETLAMGQVNGKLALFVGFERPGGIAIYTMESNNGRLNLTFQSIQGPGSSSDTWENMWRAGLIRDVDPEVIRFIPSGGPFKTPMLLVSGSYSGTLSAYEVYDDGQKPSQDCPVVPKPYPSFPPAEGGAKGFQGFLFGQMMCLALLLFLSQ